LREDHEVGARFIDASVVFVKGQVFGFVEIASGAEELFDALVERGLQV